MRHHHDHRQLSRTAEHRRALLRSLVTALFEYERIETTVAKAKEARRVAERMITYAKRNNLHSRRLVARVVQDEDVAKKLFDTIAPRFAERNGGYIRIIKAGVRKGDAAPVALIELLGSEYDPKKAEAAHEAREGKGGKEGGMAGRLRRAAERVRGRKADDEGGAVHERTKAPGRSTAKPRQTGRTGGNKGS